MSDELKTPEQANKGEITSAPTPRDVAGRVALFIEDHYGKSADSPHVSEGLWLAMQILAGPAAAACVLRQCGVNFELR